MCLSTYKSHVRKPIPEMECFKILEYDGDGNWSTPFQKSPTVTGTGWFKPKQPARRQVREYRLGEDVNGGYIHAYTTRDRVSSFSYLSAHVYDTLPTRPVTGRCYRFRCTARDVVALGHPDHSQDLAARAIYIPAFDVTGNHRNAILDM